MTSPSANEANVVLDVDYREGAFELVLSNIGSGVAYDIKVAFSRKLVGAGGRLQRRFHPGGRKGQRVARSPAVHQGGEEQRRFQIAGSVRRPLAPGHSSGSSP